MKLYTSIILQFKKLNEVVRVGPKSNRTGGLRRGREGSCFLPLNLPLSLKRSTQKKDHVRAQRGHGPGESGRGASPGAELAGTLTLEFPASRTVRKCISIVQAAQSVACLSW